MCAAAGAIFRFIYTHYATHILRDKENMAEIKNVSNAASHHPPYPYTIIIAPSFFLFIYVIDGFRSHQFM